MIGSSKTIITKRVLTMSLSCGDESSSKRVKPPKKNQEIANNIIKATDAFRRLWNGEEVFSQK